MKIFMTRQEALEKIEELNNEVYYTSHGEYTRPDYTIVKVKNNLGYCIRVKKFYFVGTWGTNKNGNKFYFYED